MKALKTLLIISSLLVFQGCAVNVLPAGVPPTPFELGNKMTVVPLGLVDYKGPHPVLSERSEPYTKEELSDIQRHFNKKHYYRENPKNKDIWEPSLIGDCDSYAMFLHFELASRGIPSRLVFSYNERFRFFHLSTEVDGWIFDNRFSGLMKKEDLVNYRWIAIGDTLNPWHEIKGTKGFVGT